jgi:hypothetical protein
MLGARRISACGWLTMLLLDPLKHAVQARGHALR